MKIKEKVVRRLLGKSFKCPKCRFELEKYPSLYYKSNGYKYYCKNCNEDFYEFEIENGT